jgi:protein-tyrosine-phosphatase
MHTQREDTPSGGTVVRPRELRRRLPFVVDSFEIVVVCTGNRFRSPIVASLLRQAAGDVAVDVQSTGTVDVGPVAALPEAVTAAHELGVDLRDHVARQVTPDAVTSADLVIAFERAHVAMCVIDLRVPRERVFTLPELADLLERIPPVAETDPVRAARLAVAAAHSVRMSDPWENRLAEIRDPLGQGTDVRAQIVAELHDATRRLGERLFPATPASIRRRGVG